MTKKERLLIHAKMVIDNLPTSDTEIDAIIDTAIKKVTIDLPVITKTVVIKKPPLILDFAVINDGRIIQKESHKQSDFTIFNKEPVRVISITDDNMNSIFDQFKKIGHLKYKNDNCNFVVIAVLQYSVGIDHLDEIPESSFDLIFNAIIYCIRSLMHDFTNSEPHSELGAIYKKQYLSEIYKIQDDFLYINDLNLKTRIANYE